MAELTINQLIKIIIGIVVVVIVVSGIYLFFENYVNDFFENIPGGGEESNTVIPAETGNLNGNLNKGIGINKENSGVG